MPTNTKLIFNIFGFVCFVLFFVMVWEHNPETILGVL